MVYVALLRGVNVGGTRQIVMRELKEVFEAAGMRAVKTYINSGNVVFETDLPSRAELTSMLEAAIESRFGCAVSVLLRDIGEMRSIAGALPADWTNDDRMKCDVIYLWDDADEPAVLDRLSWDPQVEDVRYTPGAVLRCVGREHAAKSKITRVVGTPLYQQMTIRNCNTARKLLELMEAASAEPDRG